MIVYGDRSKALFSRLRKTNTGTPYGFILYFNKKVFTSGCLESYLEYYGSKQIDSLVAGYKEYLKG